MKIFHFNDDWFDGTAIARIRKHEHRTADLPFCIIITYKHNPEEVIFDYKDEKQRDNDFSNLISSWRHSNNQ